MFMYEFDRILRFQCRLVISGASPAQNCVLIDLFPNEQIGFFTADQFDAFQ